MKAHFALVGSGALFATLSLAKKLLESQFSDTFLVSSRMILAAIFILILIFALGRRKELKIESGDVPSFAVLGLAVALAFYFYFLSLAELPFSLAVIFIFTTPLFAVVFESFMEKAKIGRNVLLGMILLLFGVAVIFYESLSIGPKYLLGMVWGLMAAACIAFAEEHIKLEERKHSLFNVVFWSMLMGGIFLAPLAIAEGAFPTDISLSSLYLIGILGFLTSAVYLLYDYSLEYLSPHVSSALFNSSALISSLFFASLFFGESVSPQLIGGGLILISASILINLYSPTHKLKRV